MAEDVVDLLETVEINAEDREFASGSCRASERRSQMLRKGRTVGQIGQGIVMRHVRDSLLCTPALCNILDNADEILRFALMITNGKPLGGDETLFSVRHREWIV